MIKETQGSSSGMMENMLLSPAGKEAHLVFQRKEGTAFWYRGRESGKERTAGRVEDTTIYVLGNCKESWCSNRSLTCVAFNVFKMKFG